MNRQEEALVQSSEDTKHLMGLENMRREPVTGQVQYHNRTPWVSAMRDLYSSPIQIHPGNLTEAETTVPQNQCLRVHEGRSQENREGDGLPKGYCICQSQEQQK